MLSYLHSPENTTKTRNNWLDVEKLTFSIKTKNAIFRFITNWVITWPWLYFRGSEQMPVIPTDENTGASAAPQGDSGILSSKQDSPSHTTGGGGSWWGSWIDTAKSKVESY